MSYFSSWQFVHDSACSPWMIAKRGITMASIIEGTKDHWEKSPWLYNVRLFLYKTWDVKSLIMWDDDNMCKPDPSIRVFSSCWCYENCFKSDSCFGSGKICAIPCVQAYYDRVGVQMLPWKSSFFTMTPYCTSYFLQCFVTMVSITMHICFGWTSTISYCIMKSDRWWPEKWWTKISFFTTDLSYFFGQVSFIPLPHSSLFLVRIATTAYETIVARTAVHGGALVIAPLMANAV